MRVRVFLRQPLFVLPSQPHVPVKATVLLAELTEQSGAGLHLKVDGYLDEKGVPQLGEATTLIVPGAKIDHVLIEA